MQLDANIHFIPLRFSADVNMLDWSYSPLGGGTPSMLLSVLYSKQLTESNGVHDSRVLAIHCQQALLSHIIQSETAYVGQRHQLPNILPTTM
ncbi:hypothetical protein EYF80_056041 [Liparis tanakae]|uniref:Uncharacterized protein n=1 Tax=Liparis tanakae TaxID=230148 RepID=A0A4Z2EY48_9TELE|nr:hypothetical protein EYF80_056041 [Liparis tanakae]